MQCRNKEACELVQKKVAEQIGDEYETEKTKDKREIKKIFKIVGLTERLSSERLVECITKQNSICEGKEFEVIKIFDNLSRREECFNALVETDVETFKNILKRKRLNIEWDSCVTMEYVRVYRCFKCLGFNHKASECFNKKPVASVEQFTMPKTVCQMFTIVLTVVNWFKKTFRRRCSPQCFQQRMPSI